MNNYLLIATWMVSRFVFRLILFLKTELLNFVRVNLYRTGLPLHKYAKIVGHIVFEATCYQQE